jgi:hypothetical protein
MPANLAVIDKPQSIDAAEIERVLLTGDLSRLNADQRLTYYNQVCGSLGLNPLTKPFAYLTLNGKTVLYALKDATEQLRKLHGVSITDCTSTRLEDVFVVTAKAQDRSGRTDAATGAVAIGNLKGEALANALMKAETKAKRRATLSICGLGMLDETEVDSIPHASTTPPLVVEAPPAIAAPERAPLPEGHFYILRVIPKQFGGDIEVVDGAGEATIYPVPDRQCIALAEQVVQEGVPVALERVKGARDGKVKVKAIHRYKTEAQVAAENTALDAELALEDTTP